MGWAGIGICTFNLFINMILIVRDVLTVLKEGFIKMKNSVCNYAENSPVCKMNDCLKLIKVKNHPFIVVDGKSIILTPRKL
jgi:hypothetical protein